MTITAFCRSEYGRGLNQQKLYRRVRRFAEEEWPEVKAAPFAEHHFRRQGLKVGERANGDRSYEVTDPETFRRWARRAAGWTQPSSPKDVRALLEGARLFARVAQGEDDAWELHEQSGYRDRAVLALKPKRRDLIERLAQIADRHLPPPSREAEPGR